MAEGSCGPSNTLQRFHKHTSVDRTLQQDRIATRESLPQGFRSSSGTIPGILDGEFEAFQSGSPLHSGFQGQETGGHHVAINSVAPELGRSGIPNWASDFQDLHISNAQAQPASQFLFREPAALQHGVNGEWHKEFLHEQIPGIGDHKIGYPIPIDDNGRSIFPRRYTPLSPGARQMQPNRHDKDFLDDGALERAFEAVDEELKQSEEQVRAEMAEQRASSINHHMENLIPPSTTNGTLLYERIGSDRFPIEISGDKRDRAAIDDAHELARTAGELLDKVAPYQNSKFRDSNFFSLMRQLRDREVQVEGGKIVEVPQPLHPGGEFYPERNGWHSGTSADSVMEA